MYSICCVVRFYNAGVVTYDHMDSHKKLSSQCMIIFLCIRINITPRLHISLDIHEPEQCYAVLPLVQQKYISRLLIL
jgi:hypothetical protein